jgi:probable rRNA maturation factor
MKSLVFVNQSSVTLPRSFARQWLKSVVRHLPARQRKIASSSSLTIVFLNTAPARRLNREFRDRDYATDVLSFPGMEPGWIGELVICPQVIARQAREHGHSFRMELGYMLLHGLLHLLGYDHEGSVAEARKMYALQDKIFDQLR